MSIPVALQMYTVREEAAIDFAGAFRRVAEVGYKAVELAGTGGFAAPELKSLLDGLGLRISGAHVSLDQLERNLDGALDYQASLGAPFVICPWLPEERRTAGGYLRTAESLNRAGAAARERGLRLCYHNHAFEFDLHDGRAGIDILFEALDPALAQAEIDTYWVQFAGRDPAAYILGFAGRAPLIHIKDMAPSPDRAFAEVGEGVLDWPAIFQACESAGAEWLIVEQDRCARPCLESAAISLRNLRQMDIA